MNHSIKVTLLNPEQVKNIFKEWGTFACECYNTPDKYDEKPNNIVKNMKSFRYVDMDNFEYSTPKNIQDIEDALKEFVDCIEYINTKRINIKNILIQNGVDKKQVIEDINYLLPRATNT